MNVYFIHDENSNTVKIGKANDIVARLNDLQVGNSNELKIIKIIECITEEEKEGGA